MSLYKKRHSTMEVTVEHEAKSLDPSQQRVSPPMATQTTIEGDVVLVRVGDIKLVISMGKDGVLETRYVAAKSRSRKLVLESSADGAVMRVVP